MEKIFPELNKQEIFGKIAEQRYESNKDKQVYCTDPETQT